MGNAAQVWGRTDPTPARLERERVQEAAAQEHAPLIPAKPVIHDPKSSSTRIETMSHGALLKSMRKDPARAREIVKMRPTEVGELIQECLKNGDVSASLTLSAGLRSAFMHGSAVEQGLLYRSVLRLEGPGASVVRDIVRDAIRKQALPPAKGMPGLATIQDPRLLALDDAEKNPGWAKLMANFHDRPDEAAKQLQSEAQRDPAAFQRHMAQVPTLIAGSPHRTRQVANAVMSLKGAKSREVNLLFTQSVHDVMGANIREMNKGINDHREGGALDRAQRLAPVLARLIAQPENARSLTLLARNNKTIPGLTSSLPHLLRTALHNRWSDEIHDEVQAHLHEGAQHLLVESAHEQEGPRRTAKTRDAAYFVGQTAIAERNMARVPFTEALGSVLSHVGPHIPEVGEYATKLGRALQWFSSDTLPMQWEPKSNDQLLQAMFERAHPVPDVGLETEEYSDYNVGRTNWKEDALEQLRALEGEK